MKCEQDKHKETKSSELARRPGNKGCSGFFASDVAVGSKATHLYPTAPDYGSILRCRGRYPCSPKKEVERYTSVSSSTGKRPGCSDRPRKSPKILVPQRAGYIDFVTFLKSCGKQCNVVIPHINNQID